MNYHLIKYEARYQSIWDDFIPRTANGTFMHKRAYMDYHADRFEDFSWMIFEGEKLKAVLPAHRTGKDLYAHNGLTYSDFLFHYKLKLEHKVLILEAALPYLHKAEIEHIHLKSIPWVFQSLIDDSNTYLYHQLQAEMKQVKPFFVRINGNEIPVNRNRKKNLKKMSGRGYHLTEGVELLPEFWQVVEQNLKERYASRPVHSLEEIQLLMSRFPNEIKLFSLKVNDKLLAGALVYYINRAIHFQYIHAVSGEQEREAVEWLVYHLVQAHADKEFISFGTSGVEGNNLHKGLVYWKQSFGSTLINQFYWDIPVANYPLLKNILQ